MKNSFLSLLFLVSIVGSTVPAVGQNLLNNGDFEDGMVVWFGNAFNVQEDAGGNSFNFTDVETAGDPWDQNISQVVEIIEGATYKLSFDASSDGNRSMIAGIGLNEAPYNAAFETVDLTTGTQTFTLTLTATDFGIPNSRVLFDLGAETGEVVIDNVSLSLVIEGVFIDEVDRRDHVYDSTRDILYISTSRGTIERYDVGSDSFLSAFSVSGTSFSGIDIARDDSFVYVADASQGGTQGVFRKFDTATGARTNLFYNQSGGEGEAWDVAVTSAGHAITTTEYNGSGWIPMRQLDLASDTYSDGIRSVRQRTHLHRSADGSTIFFLESNSSAGPIGIYDAATGTFTASASTGGFHSNTLAAVNRDGSLVAMESGSAVSITDNMFNSVELLGNLTGGFGFSPVFDIFYAVDVNTDEIIAFDTNSFAEIERFAIGEDVTGGGTFNDGVMSFSGNGERLFLSTPAGIRMISVAAPSAVLVDRGVTYGGSTAFPETEFATDKFPLLPGQTATFANYTSYSKGLNRVAFDIEGIGSPTLDVFDDFEFRVGNSNDPSQWALLTAGSSIPLPLISTGTPVNGVTPVLLTWPDNVIENAWLQVVVLDTDNTNLSSPETFYFGNAIGETGNDASNARVDLVDVGLTRSNQTGITTAPIDNNFDFDRDGRVNLVDVGLCRSNQTGFTTLQLISPPADRNNQGNESDGKKSNSRTKTKRR